MTARKGMLSDQPQLTRVTPTVLLGSWVLKPIKYVTSLITDFKTHAKWQGYIEEPTAKDLLQGRSTLLHGEMCKELTGMRSSAKSAWGVVQKLSSDKQQSTLTQEFGNPLGIPCPSCTTLT
jgi:hypothetical protein